jgi:hypothetical protein
MNRLSDEAHLLGADRLKLVSPVAMVGTPFSARNKLLRKAWVAETIF